MSYIKKITKSIPGQKHDYGKISEAVQIDLDMLDDELMKRGTLNFDSIDWGNVKSTSERILENVSHMQAFRGIILSLCHESSEIALNDALSLADVMFEHHFSGFHPKGKAQTRRRSSWAKEIVTVLETGIKQVALGEVGLSKKILSNAKKFATSAAKSKQDVSGFEASLKTVKQLPLPQKEVSENHNQRFEASNNDLDAKGRAVLRKDIQSLADRITAYDPDAGEAYLMRGYAAWLEFQFIPETDNIGRIQQQAMPSIIVDEHKQALGAPNHTTLLKIEGRLFLSPDWFNGQKMAFEMADKIGLNNVATAIVQRTQARLQKWPDLFNLKYANGYDYVDDDIVSWLKPVAKGTDTSLGLSEASVIETLDDAIALIEVELKTAQSPREKALSKVKLARYLKKEGFTAQANEMFSEVSAQLKLFKAEDWDTVMSRDVSQEIL